MVDIVRPRFMLGRCVATPGAMAALKVAEQVPNDFLHPHQHGDWGLVCNEDRQANEEALQHDDRIMSVYETAKGTRLYVLTEANRSSTCILLPDEY